MPAQWVETRSIPLADLTRYPGNARRGDVEQIRASIRAQGQYRSLVVRETGDTLTVLAGNHTRDALQAEGYAEARCEVIACTDDEARRIVLADNRIAERGGWDDEALTALLLEVQGDLDGTGYAEDDLDRLIRETDLIGNQAAAFLGDIIAGASDTPPPPVPPLPPITGAPPRPAAPASGPAAPAAEPAPGGQPGQARQQPDNSGPLPEYVQVTWLVTVEDRVAIRAALTAGQARWGLSTAAESLAAIAREYLSEKAA